MRTVSGIGRVAAVAAVVAAAVLVGFLVFGGGGGYTVKATFLNANQLVKGNLVELDVTPIGSVKDLALTPNGQAVITRGGLSGLSQTVGSPTGAIGRQKVALADALQRFPNFMRRSNTAFVNLRSTLNDVDPFVNASKPVAKKLGPFLDKLQPLLHDLKP